MGNFERFMEMLADEEREWWRKTALTDVIGKQTIDTCYTPDTQEWETGIKRNGRWYIVETYEDEEKAKIGHKKWVKKIKQNPEMTLKECRTPEEWFFD